MYSRVMVDRTLEYSYPGVAYSRVGPARVGRALEYMVTALAMDSRVQKLHRVRGGSYTGAGILFVSASLASKVLAVLIV